MFDRRRLRALRQLAAAMGVDTHFRDGLGNHVEVGAETLVRVCAALGAEVADLRDAPAALRAHQRRGPLQPQVQVAWDGRLELGALGDDWRSAVLRPEPAGPGAEAVERPLEAFDDGQGQAVLPFGVHELMIGADRDAPPTTIIAAPRIAWRPSGAGQKRWGLAVHLAALRSRRSRSVGDLVDLRALAHAMAEVGGSVVTVLPILPTFNDPPAEPSPYSPVSRLFWSELVVAAGDGGGPPVDRIDVTSAAAEVRQALRHAPVDGASVDPELAAYARFRGAQRRLGRDWRVWPAAARGGELRGVEVDAEEERFHLAAQLAIRDQLTGLRRDLEAVGVTLGLDLAVGVHPDGYDIWSRPHLFAEAMAVGAPPDAGFPSGQNWGFNPILPAASSAEGHRYLRATIAHQASLAGLLRIDHVMAFRRLYWIPAGMPLDQGTYVSYPMEELFALVCLESHLRACEIVGENLGTVPPELDAALVDHRIDGMSLAQFSAGGGRPIGDVGAEEVAFIGTHDTPTFLGWLTGRDIDQRVDLGLLDAEAAPAARRARSEAVQRLADDVGGRADEPGDLLQRVLTALGGSMSPLVLVWLEDLWLEPDPVNIPGTSSAERPNWQRPMSRFHDEALADPEVTRLLAALDTARRRAGERPQADGER